MLGEALDEMRCVKGR